MVGLRNKKKQLPKISFIDANTLYMYYNNYIIVVAYCNMSSNMVYLPIWLSVL